MANNRGKNWYRPFKEHSDVEDVMAGKGYKHYVWGEVQKVHIIGDYGVIEYISDYGQATGMTFFHPVLWTDKFKEHHNNEFYWEDLNTSYHTLEEAIVGAIAYKHDGLNSHAGYYFSRMIGLNKE